MLYTFVFQHWIKKYSTDYCVKFAIYVCMNLGGYKQPKYSRKCDIVIILLYSDL